MTSSDLHALMRSPLFQGLDKEFLRTNLAGVFHRKKFVGHTIVTAANAPGETLYVVTEGVLRIWIQAASGRRIVLRFCGPGQVLGEVALVDEKSRSATMETMGDATVLWMSHRDLEELANAHPVLWRNLARITATRLRQATIQIGALSSLDVRGRLAMQLLALLDDFGVQCSDGTQVLPFRLTQNDLSDLVGATRVSTHSVMTNWKRRGLISSDANNHFILLDRAAMEKELF